MKAKILKVGIFVNGQPKNWVFEEEVPTIQVDEHGERLWAGYTIKELSDIAEKKWAAVRLN